MNAPTPFSQRLFSLPAFGVFLALAIAACFPDVILGKASFYFRDYGVLGYPAVQHFHDSVRGGEFPMWNPHSHCGVPFFAQWGTMGAYPLSALFVFLPLPWSLSFFCLLHLWIGGVGMYLLARRWNANDLSAAVAGTAYVFNGIAFASFIWPNYFVALAWMPFVVLLAERAWNEGGRWVVGAAVASALQLGSGVPELVLLTWIITAVLWLVDFADTPASAARMFGRTVGVVLLAADLMAVQLLPFFELLDHSQRDAAFGTAKWSLPMAALANFLVPLLHCFETPQGQFFQYGQEFFSSVYLGAPIVALALVGMVKFPTARVWALVLLSTFCVVLALGDQTPVFGAVRKVIPIAGVARYPVKFLFVPMFVLPLLASLAIRALMVEGKHGTRDLIWSGIVVVAALAGLTLAAQQNLLVDMSTWPENFRQNATLSWKDAAVNAAWRGAIVIGVLAALLASMRSLPVAFAALALLVVDARTHAPKQNPVLPVEEFRGTAWNDQAGPRPKFGESRVFITPQAEAILLDVSSTNQSRVWQAKRRALWSNLNLLEAAPKVNGAATLQVREQAQLQTALYATNAPAGILDFLGVRYITSPGKIDQWSRRDTALPLVTAGQRVVFMEDAEARRAVLASGFDPRGTVFLPGMARDTASMTNGAVIEVSAIAASAHRVEATVNASAPSVVVIAQTFFPGWNATVDGTATTLWRANGAFQALAVPAGKHQVRVEYSSRMTRAGAWVSAAALLLCGLVWWRGGRKAVRVGA
jgi:hypothetical protein